MRLSDLDAAPTGFAYVVRKSGDVAISHHARDATVLRGTAAARFVAAASACTTAEAQQLMARATGNHKRGNERVAGAHPRGAGR